MIFEPSDTPRCFGVPLGEDYARSVVDGLLARLSNADPTAIAKVTLIVNTQRLARRIEGLFEEQTAGFFPRILTLADVASLMPSLGAEKPLSAFSGWLELGDLVGSLLRRAPDLAHFESRFDLAAGLWTLFEEVQSEGLPLDVLSQLDVSDQSGHWARAKQFFEITEAYLRAIETKDGQAHTLAHALAAHWQKEPPLNPILMVGSTGSRATSMLLMEAVASLPQGAVILPATDAAYAPQTDQIDEDHPQHRVWSVADRLGCALSDLPQWSKPKDHNQNTKNLLSLALRSAPVTDRWLTEGPSLGDLHTCTENLSLLEARDSGQEALAIAIAMRDFVEHGKTIALVTPNRVLTRQVSAALSQWNLIPDDSAGRPLSLTPPGQLAVAAAGLFGTQTSLAESLALWKLPLVSTGGDARGTHLLWTRMFEVWMRKGTPKSMSRERLITWVEKTLGTDEAKAWASHLAEISARFEALTSAPLSRFVSEWRSLIQMLADGATGEASSELWAENAGETLLEAVESLELEASDQEVTASEFKRLVSRFLNDFSVRDGQRSDPRALIWGTLEARVGGADAVIVAGLNEGVWPETPKADPWLNRAMRAQAGLLSPERKIGLSAHDFQILATSGEVIFSRAKRDNEVETVPSRWLSRLVNLVEGLPAQNGPQALAAMKARGTKWVDLADAQLRQRETQPPAHRPSPKPPLDARPKQLSVTEIERLVRDPYAVYARRVLGLSKLKTYAPEPDAALRGTLVHAALHRYFETGFEGESYLTQFSETLTDVFTNAALDPATQGLWKAQLLKAAPGFFALEPDRQIGVIAQAFETSGHMVLGSVDVTLTARADRIDQTDQGFAIYDYKTGKPPTDAEQKHFNRQLLLEALIAESGGFESVPARPVNTATYLRMGGSSEVRHAILEDLPLPQVLSDLEKLLAAFNDPALGYTARRRMAKDAHPSDYDHLSRFGEWDMSTAPHEGDVP